jgi:hypothetical protein
VKLDRMLLAGIFVGSITWQGTAQAVPYLMSNYVTIENKGVRQ